MKKILLFVLALGVMTSCLKEEFSADVKSAGPDFEVIATLDDEATRTQLTSNYKVFWSENDAISVFYDGDHYRYNLKSGANEAIAEFKFDPNYGTISGAIDGAVSDEIFVGVYPFSEAATLSMSDNNLVVNTVIPTTQAYSEGSFGQNAAPMIGMPNIAPKFSFKNVGTVLCIPVKADAIITKVTVATENKAIAGATSVTISGEELNVVATGENKVVLECGEGVQLNKETATNFCVVIAPGVYEANELVIRFYDAAGNYFETTNTNKKDYLRSRVTIYTERVFEEFSGTEELDLWIKAKAGAYMTAERIIPSVDNLNVEAWVKALMNQPDTKDRLEQAVTYLSLGQYDLVFDVLGGIPGFVKDLKRYEATGTYTQKVDYTGASYLISMVEGIEKINDIESLLAFMNEFEKVYEASGLKNKLDESLGSIADNFDAYIDAFVDSIVKQEPDENLDPEAAFESFRSTLKKQLEDSKESAEKFVSAINAINKAGYDYLKDELSELNAYVTSMEELLNEIDDYTYDEYGALLIKVNAIPGVNFNEFIIDPKGGLWGSNKTLIRTINWLAGVTLIDSNGYFVLEIDPSTYLTGEEKDYLDGIRDMIQQNEAAINATKAALRAAIESIQGASLVGSLETAVNNPESTTGKVLNYLFSQETFLESVKKSLRDIVTGIEEDAKDKIDNGNVDLKAKAIESSKNNALLYARAEAIKSIDKQLAATNEANLNGGPWGIFKRVLNWEKCVMLFTECGILDVYNALCDFAAIVDQIYTYNRTAVYYDIENFADYQENVDWWVLTYNEEF